MTAPERISEIQKALNDLNSTARLARFLADHLPAACDLAPGEGDPNLWCVFDVIADRLESIDERLETVAYREPPAQPGPRVVK